MPARGLLFGALALLATAPVASQTRSVEPHQPTVERWNRFAAALVELHRRQLAGKDVMEVERVGGYRREPEFYREVKYIERATGRLLSVVQWERARPERVHSIEVYIYDAQGRLARDYLVWYLPDGRNAPREALVNLHAYHGALHAFRQFDASDNWRYDRCEGMLGSETVDIGLDDYAMPREETKRGGVLDSPAYQACFAGLPMSAGAYLDPH